MTGSERRAGMMELPCIIVGHFCLTYLVNLSTQEALRDHDPMPMAFAMSVSAILRSPANPARSSSPATGSNCLMHVRALCLFLLVPARQHAKGPS